MVKLDTAGNIQWQQSYGGTGNDRFKDVLQADNGDFICVGSSESDNGDVSGLHSYMNGTTYTANADLWAMRISTNGTIKWSKLLGGTAVDAAQVVRKASDGGGYVISGNSASADGDVTGNHGFSDIWLLKINETGALVWQKTYGTVENQFTSDLVVTSDGNYVISGYSARSNRDGAPPCVVIYSGSNSIQLKVTPTGDSIWAKIPLLPCGLPGDTRYCYNLVEMPSGRLCYLGNDYFTAAPEVPTWDLYKIDGVTGQLTETAQGLYAESSSKASLKAVGLPALLGPHVSRLLPDSNILSCVTINYPNDNNFDGSLTLFNTNFTLRNIDSASPYRKRYGGSNTDNFAGIEIINGQEFIAAGYSNSNNGDVSGNHGDYDCWLVKFSSLNTIKGKAFIDNNSNGVKDAAEPYANNFYVESKKNGLVMGSNTDKNGLFINYVDTGTYTTTVKLPRPYYTVTPSSKQSAFTALNKKDSFDFALVPVAGINDLEVNMQALNNLRPGFKAQYRINYTNRGTAGISNTQVQYITPPKMDYISAIPASSQINGDTITWNTGTLAPLDSGFIVLTLQAQPLPGVDIGDVLAFYVQLTPFSGDAMPADNRDTIWQTARSSFDPNDKVEKYNGTIYSNQLTSSQSFDYTVRFQNTGNDTAFGIIVRDTLSDKLDPATFQIVAASHPYTFTLKDNKYCTWTFDDIKLADSIENEPLSHGYISYSIKPRVPMVTGDSITNRASIYFDFNSGVKTNNQLTIIKQAVTPPPIPVVTGLQNSYCSILGPQKIKISNLPATGSGITVTVKSDATVLPVAADSSFNINPSALVAGNHIVTVTFANSSDTKTITLNYTVTAAVTPDVNISANITTVVNLTNPVTITATNAAGGGASPQYTFAKDKAISNTLQAEGSSNTLTIQPNTLTVGPNWIYVKMKTSDTCFTSQTNIDSIDIERSTITGLTDLDFPGQSINIYPNPFNQVINISGLNTGKTYIISISNAAGQKVHSQQVNNSRTVAINKTGLQRGQYWLNIYDYKKHVLIGTVPLIKE